MRARVIVVLIHVAFFAIPFPHFAWAESASYSIPSLLNRALERSPQLQAAGFETEALQAKAHQAGRWENPSLEVGLGKKVEPEGHTHFTSAALSQNISWPGRLGARQEAATNLAKIGTLDQAATAIEIKGQVLELIYAYQVASEKSLHGKERLDRFKTVESYLKGRTFAAPQKRAEAGIVRSKLLVLQKERRELESSEQAAWNKLNLYLGFDKKIRISSPWYRSAPQFSLASLKEKAEAGNPDLQRQKLRVKAQESELSSSRKDAWPGFNLTGEFSRGTGASPEKNYGLGLSIPLPIFNGNGGNIKAAEATKLAEESRLLWAQQKLSTSLQSAYEHYLAAAGSLTDLSPEKMASQERDMKEVDQGFKRGQVDLITYLEADSQHFESLNAILDAQVDFLSALRELLFLAGEAPQPLEN